jgi:ribonuclease HI
MSPAGDGGKSRIPVLKLTHGDTERTATINAEKSTMLAKSFFPPKPPHETPLHFTYNKPICNLDPVNKEQIKRNIAKLKPLKAPGPDGIPNIVLMKCADTLLDRLYYIYTAMIERKIYYDPWKQSTTVVLRKPGKLRYDTPKAYRPIALLNTMSKVLTAIMSELLIYYTETHGLLPALHFGGRPGRTTTDAIHLLTHRIKDAWRKRQVTAVLFLDIEGAFPNAVTAKLLHSMRKRGVPEGMIDFVERMLTNRSTILRFDDHTSEAILLDNGIGQGDPLSMALYQYYNADILEIPKESHESAEAYVDDAILIATAKTFHEAHKSLEEMMTRRGGMIEWSEAHNSSIEYSKLALMDFAHHGVKKERPPLILLDITIEPTQNAKYLGIILDQNLNWAPQLAYVRGKGTTWTSQIKRLTSPSWGLTPKGAKKLFTSVVLPRILYGADVWCTPIHGKNKNGGRKGSVNVAKKLTTIQRAGAIAVTGGLRTTPTDTLNVHALLLPMELRIEKACFNAITRITSLPTAHPLHAPAKRSTKRYTKRHCTPLHTLLGLFTIDPSQMEKVPVVRVHPKERGSPPVRIDIPPNKDASKRADTAAMEKIKVYSDGSAHNGEVGAAAILKREGKPDRVLKLHLGTTEQHTVYEAELVGMIMGLHLIKTEWTGRHACVLNVDNQAALVAIRTDLNKPGQHLAEEVLKMTKQIKKKRGNGRNKLTFRWSAGHVGIKGNEDADKEAKTAADGDSSDKASLPPYLRKQLKFSITAAKQAHNSRLKTRWAAEWAKSPRYHRLRFRDVLTPASQKYLQYISNKEISRNSASRIFQLRAGHAPLNQYLHRFKRVEMPRCPACGHPNETVEHYLLYCPKYDHECWPIIRKAGGSRPKLNKLLSKVDLLQPLANYIEATERFTQAAANYMVRETQT